jgi:hypothetical protein
MCMGDVRNVAFLTFLIDKISVYNFFIVYISPYETHFTFNFDLKFFLNSPRIGI